MLRIGAIFVAICMVLIAASFGAVLYLAVGLTGLESALVAVAGLTGLALYNTVTTRLRDRSDLGAQIADLSRGTADLSRQVAEISRRVAAIENQGDISIEKARAAFAPLSAEMGELGGLVKQLAESVAVHEIQLAGSPRFGAAEIMAPVAEPELDEPAPKSPAAAINRLAEAAKDAAVTTIRAAIESNRVDLYLQPIVTLPQRKVRFYEAVSRLRTEDGQMLLPSEFIEPAETAGLIPRIDHMLLFRSVQVIRRLLLKNREIGLFCNISAATLNDPQLFPQMSDFMEANRALAPSLMLELKQEAWRAMGPLEQESLAALREIGFRFCMDQVTDLRMEPRELAERGVRYVKVPAPLLLSGDPLSASDIHPADLSDLLGRFGISLIADTIEAETQVVDLLDYDLRFGQGTLFSPPRPVRAEALQTAPEPEAPKTSAAGKARKPGAGNLPAAARL
jgi:cyclic-di-GMP phosphodiesterase TipF (flagellum assembly factor)